MGYRGQKAAHDNLLMTFADHIRKGAGAGIFSEQFHLCARR
jgi:hypothetical protein